MKKLILTAITTMLLLSCSDEKKQPSALDLMMESQHYVDSSYYANQASIYSSILREDSEHMVWLAAQPPLIYKKLSFLKKGETLVMFDTLIRDKHASVMYIISEAPKQKKKIKGITLTKSSVILDDHGVPGDPDGTITTYQWHNLSGPVNIPVAKYALSPANDIIKYTTPVSEKPISRPGNVVFEMKEDQPLQSVVDPKKDTFAVVMLVCDTTFYHVGEQTTGIMNTGYQVNGIEQNIFWIKGFVVRELHNEADGTIDWYFNHQAPPQDYWVPTGVYLDDQKRPLAKSIYIWQTSARQPLTF